MTLTSYEQGMVKHQDWSVCTPVLGAPWSHGRVFSSTFNNEETMNEKHELLIGRLIAIAFLGGLSWYVASSLLTPARQYTEFEQCLLDAHTDLEVHRCFLEHK